MDKRSRHNNRLGTVNGAALSSLNSADGSPFTSIYAHIALKTFSVSGTVRAGTAPLDDLSGITVTLYSPSGVATGYTAQTDENGNFTISDVLPGDYVAVVDAVSGKYTRAKTDKFTLDGTDYVGLIITLSAPFADGYPIFIISRGPSESSTHYYIYEKKSDCGIFAPFRDFGAINNSYAYDSIAAVMTDIAVESAGYSPTLYFAETGIMPAASTARYISAARQYILIEVAHTQ